MRACEMQRSPAAPSRWKRRYVGVGPKQFGHDLRMAVLGSVARVLASAALMGAVVYLVRWWPLALVVVVGAAVYLGALVLLRALDAEEWSIVRTGLITRG